MINRLFELLHASGTGLLKGQHRIRVVLVAVMAVLVLVVAGRFLVGIYSGYAGSIQDEIEMKMTRYNSLSRLLADGDRYREEHAALVRFRSEFLDSGLIQASTPALAEAQLQNMINELAEDSNLNVLSLRMLPRTQQGDITNLKIGINCRGEIGAVKDFLRKVAQSDRFLFVDQIQVQIINQRDRRFYNFNAQIVAWTRS